MSEEFPDEVIEPDELVHQEVFDEVLSHYDSGLEPLGSWTSEDLVRLGRAIDAELQLRCDESAGVNPDISYQAIVDDYC